MERVTQVLRRFPFGRYYLAGKRLHADPHYQAGREANRAEFRKTPLRTEVINLLLSQRSGATRYLEIGVRDPDDNYNHIVADEKYSVDPGFEYTENPASFEMTSDEFYDLLSQGKILSKDVRFDVIFVDGSHFAEQVDRDIKNSLSFVKDDGFVVLHDCNPPTEWHTRESYYCFNSPAEGQWNGTTWKAFLKWRSNPSVNSCCIDSDWGVGILSKGCPIGSPIARVNEFFEFSDLSENRAVHLNLISLDGLKTLLGGLG
jgi:hypothetical protein